MGSIWLAILGEWWALISAVLSMIFGIFACGILLMPGLIFSVPGLSLQSKEHWLPKISSYPLLILGFLWTYFVMLAWALGNLFYMYEKASMENLIPMMLVAYGVATAPWSSMAQKEGSSDPDSYAPMTAFFLQVASATVLISLLIFHSTFDTALIGFIAVMISCLSIQAAIVIRERYLRYKIRKMMGF